MQAIFDLGLRRRVRSAGDAVIARAGMLRIDQKCEGAALGELVRVGDAENFECVLGPIDAVAGEVPAVDGLAYGLEHLFEIELALGAPRATRIPASLVE